MQLKTRVFELCNGKYTSIKELARAMGVSWHNVDKMRKGKRRVNQKFIIGATKAFPGYKLDDLKTFFDIVRSKHPNAKIFLVGHSLGGLIATTYTVHYQHEFDGLILSGAGLKADTGFLPVLIAVVRMLSLLLPKVGIVTINASFISQDKTVVDAYVNDPLVFRGRVPVRLGGEVARVMHKLTHEMPKINLPILIMHGTADRLSDLKGSEMLYERVSSHDKTLKLYEGFYHEIFNEPGREQVFADMETWLETHLTKSSLSGSANC